MKKTNYIQGNGKLTIFFDNPFWVGVFERIEKNKLSVCKITFGAEPKDGEIFEFLSKTFYKLKFSSSVDVIIKAPSANPKKIQRMARKETLQTGIGTKSQQALKLQQEENKLQRKQISKKQKEYEKQKLFLLKQQKKKAKHKGR